MPRCYVAAMLADINLGEILWSLLVIYLMIMYFVVVITVIFDIFRSNDLSGWAKALWAIALIFLPIITLLVYLVRRGDGIGKRNLADAERAKAQTDAYIRSVAPAAAGGAASELEKAKGLLDGGAITQAEFDALKAKLLA
jgi:hypothetical protein